jgi:streptogramin lyase
VSGVKFNSKGEMYGSTYLGNIWKIDPATGDRELVANAPFGIDNITTDSNDRVFISNGVSGRIYEVLPDGALRTVNK